MNNQTKIKLLERLEETVEITTKGDIVLKEDKSKVNKYTVAGILEISSQEAEELIKVWKEAKEQAKIRSAREEREERILKEETLRKIIRSKGQNLPIRYHQPRGTDQRVVFGVRDIDTHLLTTPISVGSDSGKYNAYFTSDDTLNNMITDLQQEMAQEGFMVGASEVVDFVVDHVTESMDRDIFKLKKHKIFSFDKEEWKTNYIDVSLIDNADSTNIPAWESFKKNMVGDQKSEESWTLFCAWVWGMFEEDCIKHNTQSLWLYEEKGGAGKTTVANVLKSIIAGSNAEEERNYGSCSVENFNSFWASNIYGSHFATIEEQGNSRLINDKTNGAGSQLHAWLGHAPVSIEGKSKQPFSAILYTRLMILDNIAPTFDNGENNQTRRCLPIEMKVAHLAASKGKAGNKTKNVWEIKLYEERYNFLKLCREKFNEVYDYSRHEIIYSEAYKSEFFGNSIASNNMDEMIANGYFYADETCAYPPNRVQAIVNFVWSNYFNGGKSMAPKLYNNFLTRIGVSTMDQKCNVNGKRVNCKRIGISEEIIRIFNEHKNNELEGMKLIKLKEDQDKANERIEQITKEQEVIIKQENDSKWKDVV